MLPRACAEKLEVTQSDLHDVEPVDFGISQWQRANTFSRNYIIYRVATCAAAWIFFFYHLYFCLSVGISFGFFLLPFTEWAYMSVLLDTTLQLISAVIVSFCFQTDIKRRGRESTSLDDGNVFKKGQLPPWFPILCNIQWIAINVSHTSEPFVSIFFWLLIFPSHPDGDAGNFLNLGQHLYPTLYVVLDLLVHRTPRYMKHWVYPVCFAFSYITFTWLYYQFGGMNDFGTSAIYTILDWARPMFTLSFAILGFLTVLMVHFGTVLLVRVRLHLYRICTREGRINTTIVQLPIA